MLLFCSAPHLVLNLAATVLLPEATRPLLCCAFNTGCLPSKPRLAWSCQTPSLLPSPFGGLLPLRALHEVSPHTLRRPSLLWSFPMDLGLCCSHLVAFYPRTLFALFMRLSTHHCVRHTDARPDSKTFSCPFGLVFRTDFCSHRRHRRLASLCPHECQSIQASSTSACRHRIRFLKHPSPMVDDPCVVTGTGTNTFALVAVLAPASGCATNRTSQAFS